MGGVPLWRHVADEATSFAEESAFLAESPARRAPLMVEGLQFGDPNGLTKS
jgi:hypothetical protein